MVDVRPATSAAARSVPGDRRQRHGGPDQQGGDGSLAHHGPERMQAVPGDETAVQAAREARLTALRRGSVTQTVTHPARFGAPAP